MGRLVVQVPVKRRKHALGCMAVIALHKVSIICTKSDQTSKCLIFSFALPLTREHFERELQSKC
eukprot:2267382-Amphidinium_carterae.1